MKVIATDIIKSLKRQPTPDGVKRLNRVINKNTMPKNSLGIVLNTMELSDKNFEKLEHITCPV